MATNYPINPRIRAYGKARLDLARRARNGEDWKRIWKPPTHPYPFQLGGAWKQCIEYKVDDFAAEIGFFIDVLGLEVNSLDPGYAQFTSPQRDFYFAVVETPPGFQSTPADALRIQFMLEDIFSTAEALEERGITFEIPPQPCQAGSALNIGSFRTPHGISIELWGIVNDTVFSHYATSEDELIDLMSNEEEVLEPEPAPSTYTPPAAVVEPEDDEEEFFPGLREKEIEPPKPAIQHRTKKRDKDSATTRGNLPITPKKPFGKPVIPVNEEDAYVMLDDDEVSPKEEEIQYVDDVDGV
jgi:catechol 2,3-dioxygenase-like lactoylglutathione lyase family enzyme